MIEKINYQVASVHSDREVSSGIEGEGGRLIDKMKFFIASCQQEVYK